VVPLTADPALSGPPLDGLPLGSQPGAEARTRLDLASRTGLPWQAYPGLVEVTAGDGWPRIHPGRASRLLFITLVIRRAEQWLVDNERLVHGPLHSSIGQEAVAAGAAEALRPSDQITSTHRAHHHVLGKVIAAALSRHRCAIEPGLATGPVAEAVYRTMCEILGLADGFAGGRGGSMHLSDRSAGVLATSAIVGGGIPIATGAAFHAAYTGSPSIGLAFFGDGACSIGALHEAMAMARVLDLPMVFVVENNLYSVATTVGETVGFPDIAIRASGHDMPGIIVDGMDPVAVFEAVRLARAHAVAGGGPVLIEAKTYRYLHQSGSLAGSRYSYRTVAEEEEWLERDPCRRLPEALLAAGVLTPEQLTLVETSADAVVAAVVARLATAALPDPTTVAWGVVADAVERAGSAPGTGAGTPIAVTGAGTSIAVTAQPADDGAEVTYAQAVSLAIHRAMERDARVFTIGEEVGHLRGGAYGATRDACRDFPHRTLSSPIAENGFTGLALGASLCGLRPIVELMFPDFALEAADQLFNHVAKARHMFGGDLDVPIVVRTRTAQGRGFGPQHSADPAALFALFPGWRIGAPATAADYVGMFTTAITGQDPVLLIEHHRLWQMPFRLPATGLDYALPFRSAAIRRPGDRLTVLTWSHPVWRVLAIADELSAEGCEVEVIDLRWIDQWGWDLDAALTSINRTGAAAIVEDTMAAHSIGPALAARIHDACWGHLRHPVRLIAGRDIPTPVAAGLEGAALLTDQDIRDGLRAIAH